MSVVDIYAYVNVDGVTDFSAIVWGASAKHARGQKVGLDHVLEDEDGAVIFPECTLSIVLIPVVQSCTSPRSNNIVLARSDIWVQHDNRNDCLLLEGL